MSLLTSIYHFCAVTMGIYLIIALCVFVGGMTFVIFSPDMPEPWYTSVFPVAVAAVFWPVVIPMVMFCTRW